MSFDFVIHSVFAWENPYSSISLAFARELCARGHRVWYVNPPYTWRSLWQRRREPLTRQRMSRLLASRSVEEVVPDGRRPLAALQPPVVWPINFLPHGSVYARLRRRNERVLWRAMRRWLQKHNLSRFIYINCYHPYYLGTLPQEADAALQVYQCVDDIRHDAWTARHGAPLEEKVICQTDLVWVTSRRLYALKSTRNPHTYLIHNGVDVELFQQAALEPLPRPPDLEGLQRPIVGYTGNLDPHRIDYALLARLAEAHPDKYFVLVGPLNATPNQAALLRRKPNILLPGPRPVAELPAWLRHFDCALLPFQCNEFTASIYPLKINEYLAAGKAIVATAFSEDIRSFSEYIFLAESEAAFVELIDAAIAANRPEQVRRRMEVAHQNSWTARMEQFFEILKAHPKGKKLWTSE